jgi:trimeric autotransporter adhesin
MRGVLVRGVLGVSIAVLAPAAAQAAPAGTITTIAGGPVLGPAPATSVGVEPTGVASATVGGKAFVYVADQQNHVVRRVEVATGIEQVVAGGISGFSGDGGPAVGAGIGELQGLAVDAGGDLFVADGENDRVRFVPASSGTFFGQAMTAGDIYTIAGDGTVGAGGDGGPATSAELGIEPGFGGGGGIGVDASGDLAIADANNSRVRFVPIGSGSFFGRAMSAGDIYTIAGTGEPGSSGNGGAALTAKLGFPESVAFDAQGDLAVADSESETVRLVAAHSALRFGQAMTEGDVYLVAGVSGSHGYNGDGKPATAAELYLPTGLAFNAAGDLLIADEANLRVRLVAAAAGTAFGQPVAEGDIYTIAGDGSFGSSGDRGASIDATMELPSAVAVDQQGDVVIGDEGGDRVRFVAAAAGTLFEQPMDANDVYTVAGNGSAGFSGDGGPASESELDYPDGVALDPHGGLAISDFNNERVRYVPGGSGTFFGQPMSAGDLYTVAGDGHYAYTGDGEPATSASLSQTAQVSFDAAGDLVIADRFNHAVRFVPASSGTYFGQAMTANDVYTIAGDGTSGFAGDGKPATGAQLEEPEAAVLDPHGDLVIADAESERVRFVPASSGTFFGQAMSAGDIYTIAGDGTPGYNGDGIPATAAELNYPEAVVLGAHGGVVIADEANRRIRYLAATSGTFFGQAMIAGDIYTIAGDGSSGAAGDGGPALSAAISDPEDVALDAAGDIAIADGEDSRVRFIPANSGSFFGQAMTAGDIYTIAGTGVAGFSGDGRLGTAAMLDFPSSVTFDAAGDVVFADGGNDRVRMVMVAQSPTSPSAPVHLLPSPPATSVAPSITNATQSHSRWREGKALASVARRSKRPPLGTTFSFTLNEQAKVSFSFTQRVGGREVKHKCVAQTNKNRRKHACARTVTRGTLSFTGRAAANKVSFQGRISHSLALRPGTYTLLIAAVNSAGQRSAPKQLSFTIVK